MSDYQERTIEEFKELLDRHGADLSRMPMELAAEIKDRIETDKTAKKLFKEAQSLDHLLNTNLMVQDRSEAELNALETKIFSTIGGRTATDQNDEIDQRDENLKILVIEKDQALNAANDNSLMQLLAPGLLAASLIFGLTFGALGGANLLWSQETLVTIAATDEISPVTDEFWSLDTDFDYVESNLTDTQSF